MEGDVQELWEEIEKMSGILGWDPKYITQAREVSILLNSKQPIEGLSKPPWRGGFEQFLDLTKAVRELEQEFFESIRDIEMQRADPIYRNSMSKEEELRIRKVISGLDKITTDASKLHRDLRAQFVQSVPETKTEYVSEISDHFFIERMLRSFRRSDTKTQRFFLEFKSVPGEEYQVDLQNQESGSRKITILIGAGVDLKTRCMDIISSVRESIGLPPTLELWEEDSNHMLARIAGGIDERTLAKILWPNRESIFDEIWSRRN